MRFSIKIWTHPTFQTQNPKSKSMHQYQSSTILFISLIFLFSFSGCQKDHKRLNASKQEKDIAKEWIDDLVITREELDLSGKVQYVLEYSYTAEDYVERFIPIPETKYHKVDADNHFKKIRDIEVRNIELLSFDKLGRLVKRIDAHENIPIFEDERKYFSGIIRNFIFDAHGKLLEMNTQTLEERFIHKKLLAYDNKGRLIKVKEVNFNDTTNISYTDLFYKNDTVFIEYKRLENKIVQYSEESIFNQYGEKISLNPDSGENKEYDKNGNLVKVFYPGVEGFYSSWWIHYDYNHKNQKIRKTSYDTLGNLIEMKVFYYNDLGEMVQTDMIDQDRFSINLYSEGEYSYPYEKVLVSLMDSIDGFHFRWENKDKFGNTTKSVFVNRDQHGNLIEETVSWDYTYDKKGNWIFNKIFHNDTLETIIERQIKYL
ncbi:MAG: hypothetical protein DWQ02_26150 [Bacteroidetes bacterium]|nr:MAG: hypothetical protein DWQ02_26150 [Bacteroidota bacterium]